MRSCQGPLSLINVLADRLLIYMIIHIQAFHLSLIRIRRSFTNFGCDLMFQDIYFFLNEKL